MKYTEYTAEDFALDEYFQRWILEQDPMATTFWETWLMKNPGKRAEIEKACLIIRAIDFEEEKLRDEDFREIWQNVIGKRTHLETSGKAKSISLSAFFGNKNYLKYAASLLIGIMVAGVVYFYMDRNLRQIEYVTGYGETRSITLPDQSTVTLNANSSLTFYQPWRDGETRNVWLKGEAFFSVLKKIGDRKFSDDGKVKFVVHTDNLNVEVLGTKFNVKNRRGKTMVVLNSGKVSLNDNRTDRRLDLNPGELAEFLEDEKKYVKKEVDSERHTSWRNNKLIFDDTPLLEIAEMLEDNYNIKLKVLDEELMGRKFTGTSPANDIDILLTKLSKIFNLEIVQEDQKILLIEKN